MIILTEVALLQLLYRQPDHGYALFRRLVSLGVERAEADKTRVYRILRGLAAKGALSVTWDTTCVGKGPARKVYTLTRKGERYRQRVLDDLDREVKLAEAVLALDSLAGQRPLVPAHPYQ